ncbi:uncharacterized protein LOC128389628 [Panonychus citri]|uniref:uncharacterized protein LOC128389628 n=1 Tax=Panonychus citri TaxID=50023 RepID=UPI002306FC79|nr:uncharacterized protein LOC128389628 [Panonychus citri]
MSTKLFSNLLLINKSTFISEDIGFLTSFFCLQKDLPQGEYCESRIWLVITTIVLLSSIGVDWIYFGSGLSLLVTLLCSPYLSINLYYLIYYRFNEYRLINRFNGLCYYLGENHFLLKKLLTLGQELQIIEKNCSLNDLNSSKIVQSTFSITVRLFNLLREETKLALSLPATIEDLNGEDNYVSCLPNQLFEDLIHEENPTSYQLKSLMQLVRIQQSEYLRRILCAHISGTLKEKCQTLTRITNSLQRCKDKILPEFSRLKSLYAYHQSSCYKQSEAQTPVPLNAATFDINYSLRSIRLHLQAALLLLNKIESLSTQDVNLKHYCIMDDVSRIEKELNLGTESLKAFSKKLRKNDNTESFKPLKAPECDPENESQPVIIGENFQPTIEDQVFELFIDDDDCLNCQYQDDIDESPIMVDDFTTISSNLFQELKTALIPKAEETREREAKALGIPKEEVPMQLINDYNLKSKEGPKIPQSMRQETELANFFISNNNLTSALATRAAQISKDLKLNRSEECFGDSDNDDITDNELICT